MSDLLKKEIDRLLKDKESVIKTIAELTSIQRNEPTSKTDDYMRGMYNGMEVIRAAVVDHNTNFIDRDGKFEEELGYECNE